MELVDSADLPELPSLPAGPFLFVSYASVDRVAVLTITEVMRAAGLDLWIDQAGIAGGASYGTEISTALKASAAMVLMCSSASLASRNVRQEIMLAWRYDRPILPLLLEPTTFPDDVAYWLEGAQWIEVLDRPVETWLPQVGRALARQGISLLSAKAAVDDGALPAGEFGGPALAGALPSAAGPLIGREREVEEVLTLLGHGRWVTLTGPGGTGKTRLALEIARRRAVDVPGGAWFVDLASIADPERILPAIAAVFDLAEEPAGDWADQLSARFGSEPLLLVLDNMEQVAAGAAVIGRLLDRCAGLEILATSRLPLRLDSEWSYVVAPFGLPDLRVLPPLPVLAKNPAVMLFVERARAVRPDFVLTDGVARPVAEICHRLDGLPLAIELAAARVRLLTPAAILTRLGSRLNLLTHGISGNARQQTLRGAIGWSYELLEPPEQAIFRGLSVFVGGATVEAGEAVVAALGGDGTAVLDGIDALIDHSLLRVEGGGAEEAPRIRMLETIREYAAEQLDDQGERERAKTAHADYFLRLAEACEPDLWSPRPGPTLATLRAEDDNLRAALAFFSRNQAADSGNGAVRLAAALVGYWRRIGRYEEGMTQLERALEQSPAAATTARAQALQGVGFLAARRGKPAVARARYEEVLALRRQLGDRAGEADALQYLAELAEDATDYTAARALRENALAIREELGNPVDIAEARHDLGVIDLYQGAYDRAIDRFTQAMPVFRQASDARNLALALTDLTAAEMLAGHATAGRHAAECLTLWRTLDDRYAVVQALVNYGRVLQLSGEYAAAIPLLEEALADARELGDTAGISLALYGLGLIALATGEIEPAAAQFSESLRLSHAADSRWHIAERLEALSAVWLARGDTGRSARLLGAAARLREEGGFPVPPAEQAGLQRTIGRLTTSLGEDAFAAAMAAGRAAPLDDMVNEALSA